jgi:hypothetical protein
VIGVVGLGLGAKLLADDGKPKCTTSPPITQCPELADTKGVGLGLLVPGVILAAGSIVSIAVQMALPRRPPVTIQPVVDKQAAGVSVSGAW